MSARDPLMKMLQAIEANDQAVYVAAGKSDVAFTIALGKSQRDVKPLAAALRAVLEIAATQDRAGGDRAVSIDHLYAAIGEALS